jgi:hypothetical protein
LTIFRGHADEHQIILCLFPPTPVRPEGKAEHPGGYADHEIDLPDGPIEVDVIPMTRGRRPAGDRGPKMSRLFTRQGNPNLTSRRRHEIYLDILERPSPEERDLVETIHVERVVPGILRSVAVRARSPRVGRGRGVRTHAPQQKHPHSITSSARASRVGGLARPSALAVLAFMTSSNFV